jgi:hypothetical protein
MPLRNTALEPSAASAITHHRRNLLPAAGGSPVQSEGDNAESPPRSAASTDLHEDMSSQGIRPSASSGMLKKAVLTEHPPRVDAPRRFSSGSRSSIWNAKYLPTSSWPSRWSPRSSALSTQDTTPGWRLTVAIERTKSKSTTRTWRKGGAPPNKLARPADHKTSASPTAQASPHARGAPSSLLPSRRSRGAAFEAFGLGTRHSRTLRPFGTYWRQIHFLPSPVRV